MRSMSEGKSSVTTFTLMPSFPRSSCTMTAMRSLGLLPALVTMENSTALPPLSNNAPFCRRSEEHTSELQSQFHLVCRLLLEKKKYTQRPRESSPSFPHATQQCLRRFH